MITNFIFYPVAMPCEFEFTISRGTQSVARHVIVELHATMEDKTYVGLGEAVPSPFYGETQETILAFYNGMQSEGFMLGLDPFNLQSFYESMASVPDKKPAKAAIEMALYDLMGQITDQPLYKLWGLDPKRLPKSSYTIGLADLETVARKTDAAMERGYDVLKIKVGGAEDLKILELIRNRVPETTTIRVDANAAWTVEAALRLMPVLKDLNVEFVEEPLLIETASADRERLKAESVLPIFADETVHTLRDVPKVAPWVHGINLKLGKTGGLVEAIRMIHTARALDLKIMLGCFAESSLSITAFAHVGPLVDYLDLDGGLLLADDPVDGITWQGSQPVLPNRPGLGVVNQKFEQYRES